MKTYLIDICLKLNCYDAINNYRERIVNLKMHTEGKKREEALFDAMKRLNNENLWLLRNYFADISIKSYEIFSYVMIELKK